MAANILGLMSIFVSIASYCDPVLPFTLEQAVATARWPDRLHFGVVDQSPEPPKMSRPDGVDPARLTYLRLDPVFARGPCWARAVAMSLYDGEDWYFQIDSHMNFDRDWDERLATQASSLLPGRKGVVLSSYPNAFVFEQGQPVTRPATHKVLMHVVKTDTQFEPDHPVLMFEAHPLELDEAMPAFHVGAGCLFASGRFAQQFPYDPWLYFHGEEQALAARLFTHGWDMYHVPGLPVYHLYNTPDSGAPARPMHWDTSHDTQRSQAWWTLEDRARNRLAALVAGDDLGAYSLGTVRTMADYAAFSGIDYAARTIEEKAFRPQRRAPPPG
jgi:hypothetical protein